MTGTWAHVSTASIQSRGVRGVVLLAEFLAAIQCRGGDKPFRRRCLGTTTSVPISTLSPVRQYGDRGRAAFRFLIPWGEAKRDAPEFSFLNRSLVGILAVFADIIPSDEIAETITLIN
jgi:hypothetical protein